MAWRPTWRKWTTRERSCERCCARPRRRSAPRAAFRSKLRAHHREPQLAMRRLRRHEVGAQLGAPDVDELRARSPARHEPQAHAEPDERATDDAVANVVVVLGRVIG